MDGSGIFWSVQDVRSEIDPPSGCRIIQGVSDSHSRVDESAPHALVAVDLDNQSCLCVEDLAPRQLLPRMVALNAVDCIGNNRHQR